MVIISLYILQSILDVNIDSLLILCDFFVFSCIVSSFKKKKHARILSMYLCVMIILFID